MACSKCKKSKKLTAIRTVSFNSDSLSDDSNTYFVQSTRHSVVNVEGWTARFLPGELVHVAGNLLSALLISDITLFRFKEKSGKDKFLNLHPSFRGHL